MVLLYAQMSSTRHFATAEITALLEWYIGVHSTATVTMPSVSLMVDCKNEAARSLYAKLGYDEGKILMRKQLAETPPDGPPAS
jgi:ribosomal protein S18 acetylase RimI-like enzyme